MSTTSITQDWVRRVTWTRSSKGIFWGASLGIAAMLTVVLFQILSRQRDIAPDVVVLTIEGALGGAIAGAILGGLVGFLSIAVPLGNAKTGDEGMRILLQIEGREEEHLE